METVQQALTSPLPWGEAGLELIGTFTNAIELQAE